MPKERTITIVQTFPDIIVPGKPPEVKVEVKISEQMHPLEVNMLMAQGLTALNQMFIKQEMEAMREIEEGSKRPQHIPFPPK
jgi:hypothetical protein